MPQSRDRRPRLSAHLPFHNIPLGNIPFFWRAWGGFYLLWFGGQTRASVRPFTPMYHPARQHLLLLRGLGRLSLVVFWRTDEGVCPYFVTLSLIKETPSSLWRGRFLAMKRASLHIEETPSSFVNGSIHSPLHSERGRGWGWLLTGVRLFLFITLPSLLTLLASQAFVHQ